jgi:hypothetical protein
MVRAAVLAAVLRPTLERIAIWQKINRPTPDWMKRQ